MTKKYTREFKTVSQEEFYKHIIMYPKKLNSRSVTIGFPPSIVYYEDKNRNNVVGRVMLNKDCVEGGKNEYEISG